MDERPTYGYRRLATLLNRKRRTRGEPAVNGKRVLRVLRAAGLTLQAHTARRPGRTHDGAVVALRSNVRWCSDHREIAGRDGSIVRVLFAIDACDREILGWHATTAGISGEMVRDLMVACVERRFGATRTDHAIEWLSDNGSAYRAKDTLDTATALGLRLAFTPARSPESNGLAEAFVKTLKRDYAKVTLLPDAATILGLVAAWIEDDNSATRTPGCGCSPRRKSSAPAVPNTTSHLPGSTGEVALFAGSLSYRGHEKREMGFPHILAEDFPHFRVVELREVRDDPKVRSYAEARALLAARSQLRGIYNIRRRQPGHRAGPRGERATTRGRVCRPRADRAHPAVSALGHPGRRDRPKSLRRGPRGGRAPPARQPWQSAAGADADPHPRHLPREHSGKSVTAATSAGEPLRGRARHVAVDGQSAPLRIARELLGAQAEPGRGDVERPQVRSAEAAAGRVGDRQLEACGRPGRRGRSGRGRSRRSARSTGSLRRRWPSRRSSPAASRR